MPVPSHRSLLACVLLAASSGCASVAPKYTPLPENVNSLRDAGLSPAKLGEFTAPPKSNVNSLSIRGGKYASPYGDSYVAYLQEALRQELEDARLLDPTSAIEVAGVMTRNELNVPPFGAADAQIEARFTVKRTGEVCYDRSLSAKYEWDSSFIGAVAIPRAQQNYPTVVQRLLSALYADPDFVAAMKKR